MQGFAYEATPLDAQSARSEEVRAILANGVSVPVETKFLSLR